MDEDEETKRQSNILEQLVYALAEEVAKRSFECCKGCSGREKCWRNPINGVSKTTSTMVKNVLEYRENIATIAAFKLIEIIKTEQLKKGK